MSKNAVYILIMIVLGFSSCGPDLPEDVDAAYSLLPAKLDYNIHVKPILSDKCFACHGPDEAKQKAGLRLDRADAAFGELPESPGKYAIRPGKLVKSEFFHRILSSDPDYVMPTPDSHLSLSASEKAVLIKWIEDGAEYKPHWAFINPEKVTIPKVKKSDWPINEIDRFILSKLEKDQLKPSDNADKSILLRRLFLTLTGLPPSPSDTENFLSDASPDAYENVVDHLLASPHFGEKLAVEWMDLARFADSHGYTVDRLRDMTPYRDWVINAFNKNMPYDRFLHQQLAGDLMPNPDKEMLIATAFNRNHQQNAEGGIIEEEFQTEYVVDRTNTFGDAMLGISLSCAKCHDHKYDPISQKNYFELYSFFNNVQEAGQISWDDAMPAPTLLLPTSQQEATLSEIKAKINTLEEEYSRRNSGQDAGFDQWVTQGYYQKLMKETMPEYGLQAWYDFEHGSLKNRGNIRSEGIMKRDAGATGDQPVFVGRENGQALALDGDVYLDLKETGIFRRSEPFTIGIRLFVPESLSEGVIFHKSNAERLFNFRGYHLYLKDSRLEANLAYAAPGNAITILTEKELPKNKWLHLTVTYDGSSKAKGLKIFLDGKEMASGITADDLSKDILFNGTHQPGLQIGGWWRGLGLKGGKVDDIAVYTRELLPFEVDMLAGNTTWLALLQGRKPESLTPENKLLLHKYYQKNISAENKRVFADLTRWRTMLADSLQPIQELMVMREMPVRKKAHILLRGEYDNKGEEVFPATPESILDFPAHLPKNRYGLALWLTDRKNPLTARVAVNRFWQNIFGTGLVKTTEDFGNQGEMPSHPELLDWLAVSFMESDWDVKKMHKNMVMSATFRQDSKGSPELRDKDPENRMLARGPARRLTAEMIRDNVLVASGLINKKIGGKSIKPYQPAGLWEINSARYQADSGDAIYRRSLYIVTKRAVPNPTLATFDAVSRSYCVVRRQETNTPLQALVTLNDPTFNECARKLGEEMAIIGQPAEAISATYLKLTGRQPTTTEVALLKDLYDLEYRKIKASPSKAKGWLTDGQFRISPSVDPLMAAAYAVVTSTIINSDATLTLR